MRYIKIKLNKCTNCNQKNQKFTLLTF